MKKISTNLHKMWTKVYYLVNKAYRTIKVCSIELKKTSITCTMTFKVLKRKLSNYRKELKTWKIRSVTWIFITPLFDSAFNKNIKQSLVSKLGSNDDSFKIYILLLLRSIDIFFYLKSKNTHQIYNYLMNG